MNSPADRDSDVQLVQGMVGEDRWLGIDESVDQFLYSNETENKPYSNFDDLVQYFCGRYGANIDELGYYSLNYSLSTLTEIAAYFNRDATTLSKRIRKLLIEEHSETSQVPTSQA